MNVLSTICFAVSAILGFVAAFYRGDPPPPVSLLALSVAFLALGFVVQALVPS